MYISVTSPSVIISQNAFKGFASFSGSIRYSPSHTEFPLCKMSWQEIPCCGVTCFSIRFKLNLINLFNFLLPLLLIGDNIKFNESWKKLRSTLLEDLNNHFAWTSRYLGCVKHVFLFSPAITTERSLTEQRVFCCYFSFLFVYDLWSKLLQYMLQNTSSGILYQWILFDSGRLTSIAN